MSRNIYQMYVENGNKAGFFVRRDSWSRIYACVTRVAGLKEGELRGEPPYFGNPTVEMDVYANDGTLQKSGEELSCPGTYAYKQIESLDK